MAACQSILRCVVLGGMLLLAGCRSTAPSSGGDEVLHAAVDHYRAGRVRDIGEKQRDECREIRLASVSAGDSGSEAAPGLGLFAQAAESDDAVLESPRRAVLPEGYWRRDLWHQMGHEAKEFGTHGFWKGFKTSFWDLENALWLTAAMGASITIRETGVDQTIASRTKGHRQLGDFDEPIQILGNPATHFAGAGVLWLSSTLTQDAKQHEVARKMAQALAVNGVSTLLLKVSANTTAPNGDEMAWPSGHTSSAFTAAAVLNEYYGPLVGIPSLALAGLVGYQRIDSRVHDFSDVIFGGMMGYVIGSSIAREGKAELPELFGMKLIPYTDPETGAAGLALFGRF